ncbi:MAG: type I-C CRISPR-associated protein Cas8c/Csd1 [Oscillospiraceae bacterium]|nr:type I-C CRISPR-associated protein Cas8c/Csd1 [Oscillospiraceae bacterium]
MGLLQRAVETFDCNLSRVGIYYEGENEPLAPVAHMIAKATVEITLDQEGNFRSVSTVEKAQEKTIIPVTEASAGRSGTKAYMRPHPMCDKLSYLTAEENYYIPQLEAWAESPFSNPKLRAILAYVRKGSIRQDLSALSVKEDAFVRWRVVGLGDDSGPCWTDQKLFQAYIAYSGANHETDSVLCMVTGASEPAAQQHAKGIVALYGNAKLLSSNDKDGFTYRGRFTDETQAATVSYLASQKAHNALRWLIANQGTSGVFGGRMFLCWNPQGVRVGSPLYSFPGTEAVVQTKPSDYRAQLKATLVGRKKELQLHGNETAVVAAFDAATTGRLSVTYYNELPVVTFLERLCSWDAHCCWWYGQFGIRALSIVELTNCAFGVQRIEKEKARLVTDDRVMKKELQTLLSCRLREGVFPDYIRVALVQRAGTPQAYEPSIWRRILCAACAAIQMTEFQKKGDEIMSWSLDYHDRSFQYGRLLAVLERAEEDFYYRDTEKSRQTNAIRLMSVFRKRPWTAYEQVNRQLQMAYLPRMEPWQRNRYQRLKDEIVSIIRTFPEAELNKPLSELYLLGYDLQHNDFFNNKQKDEGEDHDEQAGK